MINKKGFLILLRIDLLCLRGFRWGMFWIGLISLLLRFFSLIGLRFWGRILRLGFRGGFIICWRVFRLVRINNMINRSLLRDSKQINKSSQKNHHKYQHNPNHSKPFYSLSTNPTNFSFKCAKVSDSHPK